MVSYIRGVTLSQPEPSQARPDQNGPPKGPDLGREGAATGCRASLPSSDRAHAPSSPGSAPPPKPPPPEENCRAPATGRPIRSRREPEGSPQSPAMPPVSRSAARPMLNRAHALPSIAATAPPEAPQRRRPAATRSTRSYATRPRHSLTPPVAAVPHRLGICEEGKGQASLDGYAGRRRGRKRPAGRVTPEGARGSGLFVCVWVGGGRGRLSHSSISKLFH